MRTLIAATAAIAFTAATAAPALAGGGCMGYQAVAGAYSKPAAVAQTTPTESPRTATVETTKSEQVVVAASTPQPAVTTDDTATR